MTPRYAEMPDAEALFCLMPFWLLEWPMIAFAGWCDAVFEASHANTRPRPGGEGHNLTVPDCIDRDGEHALFA
jgi:hypothetical protein